MTVYDDMRGFIHAHDRNGRFDVATETTPMYQMVDKAEAKNEKLKELCSDLMGWIAYTTMGESVPEETCCVLEDRMTALGIEV